ncbi:hypothetical protein AB6A40_006575 [Gnathostoma spinigerum]|uniref:Uncharacterized protein n=1 Tax=Gnathostoma spinigerum TaxID=75299 RepID=A0ABD6EJD8_9BILA
MITGYRNRVHALFLLATVITIVVSKPASYVVQYHEADVTLEKTPAEHPVLGDQITIEPSKPRTYEEIVAGIRGGDSISID